jgi:hypothetical protein
VPDWFRDAKCGIWAHGAPQCRPEWGDRYAPPLYLPERQEWMKGETADDGDALRLTLPLPQEGAFVPVVRIRGRGIV